MKKPREKKMLETARELCAEIKDLTLMKRENNKYSMALIQKEMKRVEKEIELRQQYLIDNNIDPQVAIEYVENLEKAQNPITIESPNNTAIVQQECKKASKDSIKKKGKLGRDMLTSEGSNVGNSETYSYSVSTNKRSPSRLDTFS